MGRQRGGHAYPQKDDLPAGRVAGCPRSSKTATVRRRAITIYRRPNLILRRDRYARAIEPTQLGVHVVEGGDRIRLRRLAERAAVPLVHGGARADVRGEPRELRRRGARRGATANDVGVLAYVLGAARVARARASRHWSTRMPTSPKTSRRASTYRSSANSPSPRLRER